ncbi:MAG: anaerobic ribonucleoside-triphosphate reductase activating protein [Candidatus Moranbacteria bacterium]|nr:anaerobic ribonucleoside-triphosphate reductase activating protein [Candidatus Moranbacteria bacterium]
MAMLIGGFQKLTLIDYPGKVATTVFTVGCNFRCPFCHNPELIDFPKEELPTYRKNEKAFFDFLEKRKGKLDGVCVTGGEPTVQPDILDFLGKIKKMGFLVKLDTNGSRPEIVKEVVGRELADFFAMDIKNRAECYRETSGSGVSDANIRESIRLIRESGIGHEFRTTVVPGIHGESDFSGIVELIDGAPAYYLQEFRDFRILSPELREKSRGKKLDLDGIAARLSPHFGHVGVRR